MNLDSDQTKLHELKQSRTQWLSSKLAKPQSPSRYLTNFVRRAQEKETSVSKILTQKLIEKEDLMHSVPRRQKDLEKFNFQKTGSEKILSNKFKRTIQSQDLSSSQSSVRGMQHLSNDRLDKIIEKSDDEKRTSTNRDYIKISGTEPEEIYLKSGYFNHSLRPMANSLIRLPTLDRAPSDKPESIIKKTFKNIISCESPNAKTDAKEQMLSSDPSHALKLHMYPFSHSPARKRLTNYPSNLKLRLPPMNFTESSLEAIDSMSKHRSLKDLLQSNRLQGSNVQLDSIILNQSRSHKHSVSWVGQALRNFDERSPQTQTNRSIKPFHGKSSSIIENYRTERTGNEKKLLQQSQGLDSQASLSIKTDEAGSISNGNNPDKKEGLPRRLVMPRKTLPPPKKIYPDPEYESDEVHAIRMRADHTKIMMRPTPLEMIDVALMTIVGERKSKWRIFREKLLYALCKLKELKLDPTAALVKREVFSLQPFYRAESREFLRAARYGAFDVVQKLLAREKYLVYEFDEIHMTALHWAAKRGFPEIVRVLINYHSDVNARDIIGRTPLYYSVESQNIECLQLLLAAGCNPWSTFDYNLKEFIDRDSLISYYIRKARLFHLTMKMMSRQKREEFWEQASSILMEKPL